jgi:hypothetical protein
VSGPEVTPAGGTDYPVPRSRIGYAFFIATERHEWLYRVTLPFWWARYHVLRLRGVAR